MNKELKPPDHMDVFARNARVYETLKNMGLYVEPYPNEYGSIEFLVVSTGASMRIEPVYRLDHMPKGKKEIAFWKISKVYPLTEEEIDQLVQHERGH